MRVDAMKAFAIAAAAILASTFSANAMHWVNGGNGSCETSCGPQAGGGVQTGLWKKDSYLVFYICKSNVNKQGDRPGYNLNAAYGDKVCVVPYDGKESPQSTYECLCKE
jgi:hypothetical protein